MTVEELWIRIQIQTRSNTVFWIRIHWFWIRIQQFRLNIDPDRDPGFWWPKIEEEFTAEKKCKIFSKNLQLLILGLYKGRSSYRRSLPPARKEHRALQNMKSLNFLIFLWVIFALPDPDPLTRLNPDPIQIWNDTKRTIFYCRHAVFHPVYPWVISASDDCSIRFWNWLNKADSQLFKKKQSFLWTEMYFFFVKHRAANHRMRK